MYTLAIVGVYACLASGGKWPGPACLHPPRQRSIEKPLPELTLFYTRLLILFLQPLIRSFRRAPSKKEQPPHSSCSLIPKGFHYIYFIPYI